MNKKLVKRNCIKSIFSLVAQTVIRDVETNQISIINIFEGLAAVGFPFFIPSASFFIMLENTESEDLTEYQGTITVKLNKTILIPEKAINIHFENMKKNRTIINFKGLLINEPGKLEFILKIPNQNDIISTIIIESIKQ